MMEDIHKHYPIKASVGVRKCVTIESFHGYIDVIPLHNVQAA